MLQSRMGRLLVPILMGVLYFGCASTSKFDENGNPIFNSIMIKDTTLGEYNVDIGYYTISNNINNPNSSVFVSQKPDENQIWTFILNQPSYFFIVHKNRIISKMVILVIKDDGTRERWFYKVIDDKKNETIVTSKIFGSISEHRYMELTNKTTDSTYKFMAENEARGIPDNNKIFYRVIPFQKILSDFRRNIIQ